MRMIKVKVATVIMITTNVSLKAVMTMIVIIRWSRKRTVAINKYQESSVK